MKTQSNISRTLGIIFALLIALVMATGCGNIAGTNFNSTQSVTQAPAAQSTVFSNVQAPDNSLNANPFDTQPQIIDPKPK